MQIKSTLTGETDIHLTVHETRQVTDASKLLRQIGRNVMPIDAAYEEAAATLDETAKCFGRKKKEAVKA